jgi:hypothetical protein
VTGSIVDIEKLPLQFPTHRHQPGFWEALGRAVATFGFLEEVLGKAIFALTATREYAENEIDQALKDWLSTLEGALVDPLGSLIIQYNNSVKNHGSETIADHDWLIEQLKEAADLRNALCHGSWRAPDNEQKSHLLFVNNKKLVFESVVDVDFLLRTQKHVAQLSCAVMNSVTQLGYQFPGSNGPGEPVVASSRPSPG